ncbi:hypothetical protein KL936_005403 [Ogataea polymorpha]|nr:hypothetical protein KL936_005403 [Ogataea polymorpha]
MFDDEQGMEIAYEEALKGTGSALLFKIPRLVMGENVNFQGAEDWLQKNGVEVINLKNEKCEKLMAKFIEERPGDWYEDIGESEK